jgi:hypothetical protein
MSAVRALEEKPGDEGMSALRGYIDDAGRRWKDDVLMIAGERFERRLAEEMGALRVDMSKAFAEMRTEFAEMRTELLKWSFLFWIGQFAAVSGMVAFLLKVVPR